MANWTGREVVLEISDTPGVPALGERIVGHVELTLSGLEYESRDGRLFPLRWALLIRLEQPWPTDGSARVLLTPRDPNSRSPKRTVLPVHVNVSTVSDSWLPSSTNLGTQVAIASLKLRV